jgi:hypothetical protein
MCGNCLFEMISLTGKAGINHVIGPQPQNAEHRTRLRLGIIAIKLGR